MHTHSIACYEALGTGKSSQENLYPELIMVDNNNNHLSSSLLWQQVTCATKYIDIKLYVVKERVQNHIESIEQVLADLFTKGIPPSAFREHTIDMGLRESLWFLDNKGLVENLFQNREVYCSHLI
jgi:hypothetical protein